MNIKKVKPAKKNILILMSGSIACYKACYLISKLVQNNYQVQVAASAASLKFIGNATIEGLTGTTIVSDLFQPNHIMDHIHLIRQADLVIAIPATANFINKISNGVGDDLLSTLFLAHDFTKPFLVAPAMNTKMYMHPITQASIKKLKSIGIEILETASGVLACGEVGWGKLLDPELIYNEIEKYLNTNNSLNLNPSSKSKTVLSLDKLKNQKIKPKKILITAGGTQEPIDAVRVITNLSTGKTGIQLADLFLQMGFDVTLIKAKKSNVDNLSSEVQIINFETFSDLSNVLHKELSKNIYDTVIHAAAVSDYSIASISDGKSNKSNLKSISKNKSDSIPESKLSSDAFELTLKLTRNPKLIDEIKNWSRNKKVKLIGFKMTATKNKNLQTDAVEKLFRHSMADLVVHNDLSEINEDTHMFHIYQKTSLKKINKHTKQLNKNNSMAQLINSVNGTGELSAEIGKWMGI